MISTIMDADQERVIDDILLGKELGILLQDVHYTTFVLVAHLKLFFLAEEV